MMWSTVELREFRVFLTLAEELHFGRTAARLHLTSSRVSQVIRGLEGKLGVSLFERTSRRVALTVNGTQLRDELQPAFALISDALRRAHAASTAFTGTLRVGELLGAGGPRFVEIIRAFETRHPGCKVTVYEAPWADALGPLQRGEVDLLAIRLPIERPGLVVGPALTSEPRVLAVAHDHPLAGRESVTLEDVADYQVGRFDFLPRELVADLVPFETPSGRRIPRAREDLHTLSEVSVRVALGRIVHPTIPTFDKFVGRNPEVAYVPIRGLPPSRTGLVWHQDNNDPRVQEFAHVATDVLDETRPAPAESLRDARG
jgi:DNA-binding transcriptional LysR family regulator